VTIVLQIPHVNARAKRQVEMRRRQRILVELLTARGEPAVVAIAVAVKTRKTPLYETPAQALGTHFYRTRRQSWRGYAENECATGHLCRVTRRTGRWDGLARWRSMGCDAIPSKIDFTLEETELPR
jgi:hypothetical protein